MCRGSRRILSVSVLVLLLFFFLTPVVHSCLVPENESISYIRRLPEELRIVCSELNPLDILFTKAGCLGAVDQLCLDSANPSPQDFISFLSPSEAKIYAQAIKHFEASNSKLLQAKKEKNDLLFQISAFVTYMCNDSLVTVTTSFLSVPATVIGCYSAVYHYDTNARNIVKLSRESIEFADKGVNEVLDNLGKDSDDLYCIGGGYENSTSISSSAYDQVRDFIRFSKLQLQPDPEAAEVEVSKKWAVFSNRLWKYYEDIQDNSIYNSNPSSSSSCEFAALINETVGGKSPLKSLVDFHRQILIAKDKTLAIFQKEKGEVEILLRDAERESSLLKKEEYSKITSYFLLRFLDYNSATSSDERFIPSNQIRVLNSEIYGEGFEHGAKDLYGEAIGIYQGKSDFYALRALEKLKLARYKLNSSLDRISEVKEVVDSIKIIAKDLAQSNKDKAENSLNIFDPKTSTDVQLLTNSHSKFDQGAKLFDEANFATTGQAVVNYKHAMDLFNESIKLLDGTSQAELAWQSDVNESLTLLDKSISAAKLDDIEVSAEQNLLDNAKSLLSISLSEEDYLTIKNSIDESVLTLLSKAKDKYAFLSDLRNQLKQKLSVISEFYDTTEIKKRLDKFEAYVSDDDFDTTLTLGRYKIIDSNYADIDKILSDKLRDSFSAYLAKTAKITRYALSRSIVDEETDFSTDISLTNPYTLGLEDPIAVQIKGIPFDLSSSVTVPVDVKAVPNEDGMSLFFKKLKQNSVYHINVSSSQKLVETVSQNVKRVSLSQGELVERIDVDVSSKDNLENVHYKLKSLADSCAGYRNGRAIQTLSDYDGFDVNLGEIRKGNTQFYFVCRYYNPISIYESNFEVVDQKISYLISIRSNIGSLEDVTASIFVPANIANNSIKIYEPTGVPAQGFTFFRSGDRYLAQWKIKLLTDQDQMFSVTYEVSQLFDFVNKLMEETSNYSKHENVDVSSFITQADDKIRQNKLDAAIELLQKAQKTIDSEKNLVVQRESILNRFSNVNDTFDNLRFEFEKLTKEFRNSSLTTELSSDISKKFSEFDSKSREFNSLIASNKISDALAVVKSLEKLVEDDTLSDLFYKKQKEASDEINMLGTELTKVVQNSKNGTNSPNIEYYYNKFDELRTSLLQVPKLLENRSFFLGMSTLENVTTNIGKLNREIKNESESVVKEAISTLSGAKQTVGKWKKERDKHIAAIKISNDNLGNHLAFDVTDIENKIKKIDKEIKEIEAISAVYDTTNKDKILENLETYKDLKDKLSSVDSELSSLENAEQILSSEAKNAIETTRILFNEQLKNSSKDDRAKLEALSTQLYRAKSALDGGNFLDSLLYTEFASGKVKDVKNSTDPSRTGFDWTVLAAGSIILILSGVSISLLRREGPKKPKLLERIETDTNDANQEDYSPKSSSPSSSPPSPSSSSVQSSSSSSPQFSSSAIKFTDDH